jgi:hypothetical protein
MDRETDRETDRRWIERQIERQIGAVASASTVTLLYNTPQINESYVGSFVWPLHSCT